MGKTKKGSVVAVSFCMAAVFAVWSCKPVNAVYDSHFDEDGHLLPDSSKVEFKPELPKGVLFFMETSGSMNGFLRANKPTDFKHDVWSIVSNFGNPGVFLFNNHGKSVGAVDLVDGQAFQQSMSSGQFVSSNSTMVTAMFEAVLDAVDFDSGGVAVLISDMKYSPVGNAAMPVLLKLYSTDIRNIVGRHQGLAYSLIGAYSEYLDGHGNVSQQRSPYYYLIVGKDRYIPEIRNDIITLLGENYIEDVEVGFDYKTPSYEFGVPEGAIQLDDGELGDREPSFVGMDSDICRVVLKLDLSSFRWKIADESVLRDCLEVSSVYGAKVTVGDIRLDVTNHKDKKLLRNAVASVDIVISDMLTDADVIQWKLSYPDKFFSEQFIDIISNASDENDLSRSFSLNDFIAGLFAAEQNHWDETPNYILVSKNQ